MIGMLERLSMINGISGNEDAVREYICEKIAPYAEYQIDPLGNVIAHKKGRSGISKKLMVSAHMDEVGMVVIFINSDGTLKIAPVGGVDPRVVFGRRVQAGKNPVLGVIGSKAVHNLTGEERKTALGFDKLYVDIGCDSKEQAEKLVSLGDPVTFCSDFIKFGNGCIKGKAIDDRAGCAIMLELIRQEFEYDLWFTFVVQEEIGLRGSRCAAFTVEPEYAIVLESTTASDIPSASGADRICSLGCGPVVSFMDNSTIYNKELYQMAFETAEQLGIPCQTKTGIAGGNDAGAIHVSRGGVKTIAVSVPTRYLHSPSCVIKQEDLENSYKLVNSMINRILSK